MKSVDIIDSEQCHNTSINLVFFFLPRGQTDRPTPWNYLGLYDYRANNIRLFLWLVTHLLTINLPCMPKHLRQSATGSQRLPKCYRELQAFSVSLTYSEPNWSLVWFSNVQPSKKRNKTCQPVNGALLSLAKTKHNSDKIEIQVFDCLSLSLPFDWYCTKGCFEGFCTVLAHKNAISQQHQV